MRIGIDLDNTFCTDRYESGGIALCEMLPNAKETIEVMREKGHEVIFFTHRSENMKDLTLKWLAEQGIEYDGIVFGKPHFDWYIGDEAEKFTTWMNIRIRL